MANEIPPELLAENADVQMRRYHYLWHAVRRPAILATLLDPQKLRALGWEAANEGEKRSGLDFLQMHRLMVRRYRARHKEITGQMPVHWLSIPDSRTSADWPLPADAPLPDDPEFLRTKRQWLAAASGDLRSDEILELLSLDTYGSVIETGIHSWMHTHWGGAPPTNAFSNDLSNDWLPGAYSSHVNPIFWQLHGWVDDCIDVWARCHGWTAAQVDAELSNGWIGPREATTHMHHGHASVPDEVWALVTPLEGSGPTLFWM